MVQSPHSMALALVKGPSGCITSWQKMSWQGCMGEREITWQDQKPGVQGEARLAFYNCLSRTNQSPRKTTSMRWAGQEAPRAWALGSVALGVPLPLALPHCRDGGNSLGLTFVKCDGLNASVPPNSHAEVLAPRVKASGGDNVMMMSLEWDQRPGEGTPESYPPLPPREHPARRRPLWTKKQPPQPLNLPLPDLGPLSLQRPEK